MQANIPSCKHPPVRRYKTGPSSTVGISKSPPSLKRGLLGLGGAVPLPEATATVPAGGVQ